MQDGRFSTIRFNEWICVTAQYEKAVARIGRQVYQGFSKGIVNDFTSLEMCREISDTFAEAREIRADLEEELERDALDGLSIEETKTADEHRTLTQGEKTKRNIKLKFTRFMGRQSINRSLAAHRDRVKNLSRDLGLRALVVYQDEPVLKVRGHKALCRLAERLNDDADKKWQEIVAVNKSGPGGLSFHTILINFVGNFANFSKGTALGKFLLKFFKYNESEENEKLKNQFEGSATAQALQAQMEEIDEPHLDVGREIDNMQQEYEETPMEWGLPGGDDSSQADFPADDDDDDFGTESVEKWEPEADTWNPDAADDDFLDAVADAPDFPETPAEDFEPEPAPPPAGPTLLRQRPEPEAEAWNSDPEPPPAPKLPQVGMSAPTAAPTASDDDWGWGESSSDNDSSSGGGDDWAQAPNAPDPFAAPTPAAESEPDPFAQYQSEPAAEPAAPAAPDPFAPPQDSAQDAGRARPPFQRSGAAPTPPPPEPAAAAPESQPPFMKPKPKEQPLGDWNPEESFEARKSPSPPKSATSSGGWGTPDVDADYGWGSPAPSEPAAQAPTPPAPEPQDDFAPLGGGAPAPSMQAQAPPVAPQPPTPAMQTPPTPAPPEPAPPAPAAAASDVPLPPMPPAESGGSDPLLQLLTGDEAPTPPSPPSPPSDGLDDLGDDLLPDFLKDRKDDEGPADSGFIPELPSFVQEEGPKLDVMPFGSKTGEDESSQPSQPPSKPFIPELPDL